VVNLGIFDFLLGRKEDAEPTRIRREIEELKGGLRRLQGDVLYIHSELQALKEGEASLHISERVRRLENRVESIAGSFRGFSELAAALRDSVLSGMDRLEAHIRHFLELSQKSGEETKHLPTVDTMSIQSADKLATVDTKPNFNDLTPLEKKIVVALARLSDGSRTPVPFGKIVFELFPDREYIKAYSTVSEYLSLLAARNIVKRHRIGNKTHISLTQEATAHIKELRRKIVDTVGKFVDTV
jgi:hypothetical protein